PGAACWRGRSSALACRCPGLPRRRRQTGPTTHCLHPPRWERTMDILQAILATLVSEFSDLPDRDRAVRVALRVRRAARRGGVRGAARGADGKAAGIRTHVLVSCGAARFVLGSEMVEGGDAAMSRVVQGIVAGIGFLGAGTIIKGEHMNDVKGLTTAAGVWMTAAVGVCVGLGL